MLSILIPCYNYSVVNLAEQIHTLLTKDSVIFEILCLEDGSESQFINQNAVILKLSNTKHLISEENHGRIKTRQQLAKKASYDWLLFLDADVIPKNETYISEYLNCIGKGYNAIYGGFIYGAKPNDKAKLLRWKYGKNKEQVDAKIRNAKPYKIVISGNFLIKKEVFITINSEINKDGYGYDNYFGALLKLNKVKVLHINNEVYHLGIEKNEIYIGKTKLAVKTLYELYRKNKTLATENDLLEIYKRVKSFNINSVLAWFFKRFSKALENNLKGKNPSLIVLQCYKLSYLSFLDR